MDSELRARREALVRRHIDAENRHDVEGTVATMARPHYDVVAWGMEVDGADDVAKFLGEYFTSLPGMVEVWTHGFHTGDWQGIPANGNPIDIRSIGIFYFDGEDMIGELVMADTDTLVRQMRGEPAPG
jgi:hypothetical protein